MPADLLGVASFGCATVNIDSIDPLHSTLEVPQERVKYRKSEYGGQSMYLKETEEQGREQERIYIYFSYSSKMFR